jgi:hypothetical protein
MLTLNGREAARSVIARSGLRGLFPDHHQFLKPPTDFDFAKCVDRMSDEELSAVSKRVIDRSAETRKVIRTHPLGYGLPPWRAPHAD